MVRALTLDGLCPPTTEAASPSGVPALEAVGGFDETLPSYQDWELWYRLALAGCEVRQSSAAAHLLRAA